MRSIRIILLLIGSIDSQNDVKSSTIKQEDEFLFFGVMKAWVFGMLMGFLFIELVAMCIACAFDMRNRQSKMGKKLNVSFAPPHELKKKEEKDRSSSRRERHSAKDASLKALLSSDKDAEEGLSTAQELSSGKYVRLNKEVKHAQLIEAIYVASGRQVPEHYAAVLKDVKHTPLGTPIIYHSESQEINDVRSTDEKQPTVLCEERSMNTENHSSKKGLLPGGRTIKPGSAELVCSTQVSPSTEHNARSGQVGNKDGNGGAKEDDVVSGGSSTTIPKTPGNGGKVKK